MLFAPFEGWWRVEVPDRHLTTDDARTKLKSLYPSIQH